MRGIVRNRRRRPVHLFACKTVGAEVFAIKSDLRVTACIGAVWPDQAVLASMRKDNLPKETENLSMYSLRLDGIGAEMVAIFSHDDGPIVAVVRARPSVTALGGLADSTFVPISRQDEVG